MCKYIAGLAVSVFMLYCNVLFAGSSVSTQRIPLLSNDHVSVWKTIIYPSKHQMLKAHRHDHDRVVVALDSGILKITNDKNN